MLGSGLHTPTTPAALGTSTPMAIGTTTTARTLMARSRDSDQQICFRPELVVQIAMNAVPDQKERKTFP